MKKMILFGAFAVLTLASCKKDYSCKCTGTSGGATGSTTTTINDTKKNAEAKCNEGDVTAGTASIDCEIQ
jgi:hypothetical protein